MAHSAVSDPNTINHAEKIENTPKRMNELKQMMLDVQKNEKKERESYPNVSFMSTDHNFEREKTLTKSAICSIKRHERRKKLRRDIYLKKKNRIQISDTSKTSQILN